MMRYRLRTLMIVLALGPLMLAVGYAAWHEPALFWGILLLTTLALFMWGHLYLAIHSVSSTDQPE